MMNNNIKIAIVILVIGIGACNKKTSNNQLYLGTDYYPIETGKYITYMVDSTLFDDFTGLTTYKKSYIKDVIDTPFYDLENRKSFFVKRYIKANSADTFTFKQLYYITQTNGKLEYVIDNLRFVKMVYPVSYNGSWEGNQYIINGSSSDPLYWLGQWNYQYAAYGKAWNNDSLGFNNTITVNQISEAIGDTLSTNKNYGIFTYSQEKYAKGVGMVYKKIAFWKKEGTATTGKNGFEAVFNIIDHNF
jgi:hypothetical protein